MQNPFPVHHSPHVCNKKWNIPICVTFTCNWLDWSWSRSRSFWSRSHDRFLVSVSISVSHSLVSVLALVSLCSGLINKPGSEPPASSQLRLRRPFIMHCVYRFAVKSTLTFSRAVWADWWNSILHRNRPWSTICRHLNTRHALATGNHNITTGNHHYR